MHQPSWLTAYCRALPTTPIPKANNQPIITSSTSFIYDKHIVQVGEKFRVSRVCRKFWIELHSEQRFLDSTFVPDLRRSVCEISR